MFFIDCHTHQNREQEDRSVLAVRNYIEGIDDDILHKGYYSCGLHPWYPTTFSDFYLKILGKKIQDPFCLAVGECGLDRLKGLPLKEQQQFLYKQIELASYVHKPIILHIVKCYNELIHIKKKYQNIDIPAWIIHGFRGKPQLANTLINNGFILSMGPYFNKESLVIAYERERLLLETDDVDISIQDVYKKVSLSLGITVNCLMESIGKFFGYIFGDRLL